jgi:hypothetical protein
MGLIKLDPLNNLSYTISSITIQKTVQTFIESLLGYLLY